MTKTNYKKIFRDLFKKIGVKKGHEKLFAVMKDGQYLTTVNDEDGEMIGERLTKDWRFASAGTYTKETPKFYEDLERATGERYEFCPAPGVFLDGITEDTVNGFSHEGHEDMWYRG